MQYLPLYYTIPIVENAALRPNMKAVFSPVTPFSAVSAISGVFGRLAGFVPALADFITNKTAGAHGEGGPSKTCNPKRVTCSPKHETHNHLTFSPAPPLIKTPDRCGSKATPRFLALEKQEPADGEVNDD